MGSFPQWSLELLEGEYHVDLTYAAQENDGGEFELTVADKVLMGHAVRTPKKNTYLTVRLGTIHLPAGQTSLTIKPRQIPRGSLMSLLRVDLLPVGSPGSGVAIAMGDALAGAAAVGSNEGDKNDRNNRDKRERERERDQCREAREHKRPTGAVTALLLVDVQRNETTGSLVDGMVVNLADFEGKQFTVQATVKGEVQSVRFEFKTDDGRDKKEKVTTENDFPYALAGDREGAMLPLQTPPGSYRLSVIPFAEPDGKGRRGPARSVRFRIEDRSSLDTIVLAVADAELTGDELQLEDDDDEPPHITSWRKVQDEAVWAVEAPAAGLYRVEIDYASDRGGGEFEMRLNAHRFTGTIHPTGGADQYRPFSVGEVALPAGRTTLKIKPTRLEEGQPLMNLREVRIMPVGR